MREATFSFIIYVRTGEVTTKNKLRHLQLNNTCPYSESEPLQQQPIDGYLSSSPTAIIIKIIHSLTFHLHTYLSNRSIDQSGRWMEEIESL